MFNFSYPSLFLINEDRPSSFKERLSNIFCHLLLANLFFVAVTAGLYEVLHGLFKSIPIIIVMVSFFGFWYLLLFFALIPEIMFLICPQIVVIDKKKNSCFSAIFFAGKHYNRQQICKLDDIAKLIITQSPSMKYRISILLNNGKEICVSYNNRHKYLLSNEFNLLAEALKVPIIWRYSYWQNSLLSVNKKEINNDDESEITSFSFSKKHKEYFLPINIAIIFMFFIVILLIYINAQDIISYIIFLFMLLVFLYDYIIYLLRHNRVKKYCFSNKFFYDNKNKKKIQWSELLEYANRINHSGGIKLVFYKSHKVFIPKDVNEYEKIQDVILSYISFIEQECKRHSCRV